MRTSTASASCCPILSRRHDPAADYAWRVRIERTEWRYALRVIAGELDYRDFKAAVATRQGRERAGVYEWVWRALYELQDRTSRSQILCDALSPAPAGNANAEGTP